MACYQTARSLANGGAQGLSTGGACLDEHALSARAARIFNRLHFTGKGRVTGIGRVSTSGPRGARRGRAETCARLGSWSDVTSEGGWTTFKYDSSGTGADEAAAPEVRPEPEKARAASSEESMNGSLTPGKGGANSSGPLAWLNKYRQESTRITEQVRAFGLAGVLSYGIFNTLYYLITFLFVWFYVAPSPGGLGFPASAQRFTKLFAMVWAGSQVTKLIRAGCALALAPVVDKGLDFLTQRCNFKSRTQAFSAIVGGCFAFAFALFVVMTGLWA